MWEDAKKYQETGLITFWDILSFLPFLPLQTQKLWPQKLLHACLCSKSLQSCLTLCNPMDYSLPGSSIHGILQARILGWVPMPFFKGSSPPSDQTHISCSSCIAGGFFTTEPLGKSINSLHCHNLQLALPQVRRLLQSHRGCPWFFFKSLLELGDK